MKALDLMRKGKSWVLSVLGSVVRTNLLSVKIEKKEKETRAKFTLRLTPSKSQPCCVRSAWLRWRRHSVCGWKARAENAFRLTAACCQKASSLYKDFSKGPPETGDTKPCTPWKGFRSRFGLESIELLERERPHSRNFHYSILLLFCFTLSPW